MKRILLGLVAIATLSFGSATMFNGTSQEIKISSTPSDAQVLINGMPRCQTPCTLKVKRKSDSQSIVVRKNGFKEQYMSLSSSMQPGWFVLDIFWDLGTTDAMTGAWYEYEPGTFAVELKKK